ncbi:XdhC family protein [Rahnella aquatilis]|nr:XdhC family protein [Rahnella aquatilis]
MQHLDNEVISQAITWLAHQPVWLCTVLNTYGSSPRAPGALMAATRDGHFCGSLSGGCVEENFLQRIAAGEYRQPSQIVHYGGGGLTPDIALPCGGSLDVLVEYLPATAGNAGYLQRMGMALAGHYALSKSITPPAACDHLAPAEYYHATQIMRDGNCITLHLAAPPRLLIAGLSGVALYCADFACALGFEVVVCECRDDVLENFLPRLKSDIRLERQFPAKYLEQQNCHANTAIVALTHDPRMDDLTLMEAVNTPAFYIGAMGSQLNSARRRERLQSIADFSEEDFSRLHAPVGLHIGSKTPAEIALAVMADIVKHKNGL